jgi:hypothetical protein
VTQDLTIKELYELAIEYDLLHGVMGDGRDMSQRTKLGLALGNREGQVWGGKKIVIPKDGSGRRRIHRLEGVLYRLMDIGGDPTTSTPSTGAQGSSPDEPQTPRPHLSVPSRHLEGERVQATVVSGSGEVLAWDNHPDDYVLGFMNQREYWKPLGD